MSASRLARGSLLAASQARPHRLICRTFVGHRQRRQPPSTAFRSRPASSNSSQTVCIPHRYPFFSFRRPPRRRSPRLHRQEARHRLPSRRHRRLAVCTYSLSSFMFFQYLMDFNKVTCVCRNDSDTPYDVMIGRDSLTFLLFFHRIDRRKSQVGRTRLFFLECLIFCQIFLLCILFVPKKSSSS